MQKGKKMMEIDGRCKDCIVLPACKNKEWYKIITTCGNIRLSITEFATIYVQKKTIAVKIRPLGKIFTVGASSEQGKYIVGGKL